MESQVTCRFLTGREVGAPNLELFKAQVYLAPVTSLTHRFIQQLLRKALGYQAGCWGICEGLLDDPPRPRIHTEKGLE